MLTWLSSDVSWPSATLVQHSPDVGLINPYIGLQLDKHISMLRHCLRRLPNFNPSMGLNASCFFVRKKTLYLPVRSPGISLWHLTLYSSSTSYVEYQAGGGKGLVDLVNQLTLERCHSFWFYGSCRKRIPIRDSSMPKRILSQCGVSSKMFIGLIVPTTCSSVRWD